MLKKDFPLQHTCTKPFVLELGLALSVCILEIFMNIYIEWKKTFWISTKRNNRIDILKLNNY